MISEAIDEIIKSKLNWAYIGHKNFLGELKSNLVKDLYQNNSKGFINVAVFGYPQVGKTTLILKLLGIDENSPLHKILRAGRPKGKSVTSSVFVYLISDKDDDKFYLKEFDSQELVLTINELQNKLIEIRNKVENNNYQLPDLNNQSFITIKIPKCYFSEKFKKLNVNILDLPGVNSSDEKEMSYVNNVVKNVIPFIDLILIVESSNQFAGRFNNLDVKEINRYKILPSKFRLILTYTFSNESEKEWIQKEKIEKNRFLERVYSELRNSIKDFPNNLKVYPIEFGDSWLKFNQNYPNLFSDISSLNEILINELLEDINNSSSESSRFIEMTKFYKSIDIVIKQLKDKYKKEINELVENKKSILYKIDIYKKNIKSYQNQLEIFEKEIKELNKKHPKFEIKPFKLEEEEKIKNIRSNIYNFKYYLIFQVRKYLNENNYSEKEEKLNKIRKVLDEKIIDLEKKYLKKIKIFFNLFLGRGYKYYNNNIRQELKKILYDCKKEMYRIRNERINNEKIEIQQKIHYLNEKIKTINDKILDYETVINKIKQDILKECALFRNDLKLAKDDSKTAKKFYNYLINSFIEEKLSLIESINSNDLPEKKFFNFIKLGLMTNQLLNLDKQLGI